MAMFIWVMLAAFPPQAQVPPCPSAGLPGPAAQARIERALETKPALTPDTQRPVFRMEVFGRKPTIIDFIGTEVLEGPVPAGSRAHQEFLAMVTPDDVRGYAPFTNTEGAVVAATSLFNAALMQAAVRGVKGLGALNRRRAQAAASREVAAALAELQRARAAAGLPPQ